MAITFKNCPEFGNKGILVSPTFEVQENKVPLFFHLEAKSKSYGFFVIWVVYIKLISTIVSLPIIYVIQN